MKSRARWLVVVARDQDAVHHKLRASAHRDHEDRSIVITRIGRS